MNEVERAIECLKALYPTVKSETVASGAVFINVSTGKRGVEIHWSQGTGFAVVSLPAELGALGTTSAIAWTVEALLAIVASRLRPLDQARETWLRCSPDSRARAIQKLKIVARVWDEELKNQEDSATMNAAIEVLNSL